MIGFFEVSHAMHEKTNNISDIRNGIRELNLFYDRNI
jgi:hypothetical protein